MKIVLVCLLALSFFIPVKNKSQDVDRLPVWGIAKMTFQVSNFQVARHINNRG